MTVYLRSLVLLLGLSFANGALAEDFPFYCQSHGGSTLKSFTVTPSFLSPTGFIVDYVQVFADSDTFTVTVTVDADGTWHISGTKDYPMVTKHFRATVDMQAGEGTHQFTYSFAQQRPEFSQAAETVYCQPVKK